MPSPTSEEAAGPPSDLRQLAPGLALASAVAASAMLAAPALRAASGGAVAIPAMVIALVVGVALSGPAARPLFQPGLAWCVRTLLRAAIALLGLRIALGDIVDLGWLTAALVVAAMIATLVSGFALAALVGLAPGFGALAGAATAVCGASATLATATVVPNYPQKSADVAFAVIAANAVSTLVMVLYPPLASVGGLDAQATGVFLGATIHDMAQVVGAGYAVSDDAGNAAVIVKLFRVFLLLPVVLAIGWWFVRRGGEAGPARVPVPMFAVAFLGLCVVNSVLPGIPALEGPYAAIKPVLVAASAWGLLIAISALGLGTSLASVASIGWRHLVVFTGTTLVILAVVLMGLRFIG